MKDRLEITLRIALDRSDLARRLGSTVDQDTAFFIFGLVSAQLIGQYGDHACQVEMISASGVDQALIDAMNELPRSLKQTRETLLSTGEVVVTDPDLLVALRVLEEVTVTPKEGRWLVTLAGGRHPLPARPRGKGVKH